MRSYYSVYSVQPYTPSFYAFSFLAYCRTIPFNSFPQREGAL